MSKLHRIAALVLTGAMSFSALAQQGEVPPEYYDGQLGQSAQVSALGSDLFGEKTNLVNGSTVFYATDISVRTNSGLPMSIGRRLDPNEITRSVRGDGEKDPASQIFGKYWELDVPFIKGTFDTRYGWVTTWDNGQTRCSDFEPDAVMGIGPFSIYTYDADRYWNGNHINIPNVGEEEFLHPQPAAVRPANGEIYSAVTRSNWWISCLPTIKNGAGQGFKAILPDGTTYYFDWIASRSTAHIIDSRCRVFRAHDCSSGIAVPRSDFYLYATRVEDRFGNWITYSFDPIEPFRLTAISSSDNASISITYGVNGKIATASSNGRTWSYSYEQSLASVTQPDGGVWKYQYDGLDLITFDNRNMWSGCVLEPGTMKSSVAPGGGESGSVTITHPSGAVGTFMLRRLVHGTNRTPGSCTFVTETGMGVSIYYEKFSGPLKAYKAVSISNKTISGPGLSPASWAYTYVPTWSWVTECPQTSNCTTPIRTDVANPDGTIQRYYFESNFDSAGQMTKISIEQAGAEKRRIDNSYLSSANGQAFPNSYGTPGRRGLSASSYSNRALYSSAINQDGVTYTTTINDFDYFVQPTSITRSSTISGGHSRTDTTTYHDNLSKWVLGQVASTSTSGMVPTSATYDATTALPRTFSTFGVLRQTLTYNTDGTVATIKDGNNNVTTLSNWKRGIPQTIQHPATPEAPSGSTESAVVNDSGWITSTTDENANTTSYQYDGMGRVSRVIYPTGDTVPWADKVFSFQQINQAEMGVPAGHWRQAITQGNYEQVSIFDALWRPVVQYERDTSNNDATYKIVLNAYDHEGRPTFASYPRNPYADGNWAIDTGIWTTYDALGRVKKVEQDSELGKLTTSTSYEVGGDIVVTNPRNQATRTKFAAWDQPTTDYPIQIIHPEGATTTITREANYFLRPKSIQRSGTYAGQPVQAVRSYFYDGVNRLCRTDEPETGSTVMGYDYNDNLTWSAAGVSGLNTFDCDHVAAYTSGRAVNRSYDARNRLHQMGFPDGLGNQTWTYTKDGLPASITTYNGANNTAAVVNRYEYNKRGLPLAEHVEEPGVYSWRLGYEYDANANLRWQSYPTGLILDYLPNALGQATKVVTAPGSTTTGTYASGVGYYPNGAIKQFTYGNGIVHTMMQNARQLPQTTQDGSITGFTNLYDANGNTTLIDDLVQGQNFKRYLSYDGLDRLTAAGSAMFGGSTHYINYAYDPIDNLRAVTHPGVREHAYWYNAKNQLTNVINTGGATVVGLSYGEQGNLHYKNNQQYGFDYGNRLRWVMGKENYRYDGLGRRTKIAKDNGDQQWHQYSQSGQYLFNSLLTAGGVQTTQELVYLGGSAIATIDHNWPSNTIIATKFQHTDALGSPVATTNTSGALIERTNYEPYGSAINKTVDGIGYTGHVMDGATGLTYMQQRYYDGTLGRFLSVDPVTASSSTGANFNRYWYADNNPYRFVDPDGRASTGEILDQKIDQAFRETGGGARAAAWVFAAVTWKYLGAEGVSQVADKGTEARTADKISAAIEIASMGKGGTVLRALGGARSEAKAGAQVLLDSNVTTGLKADPTLGGRILAGETPVLSHVSIPEMRNAVTHGNLKGVPGAAYGLQTLPYRPSLDARINLRGMLPDRAGRFGDGIIGASAVETGIPLITNDKALKKAVEALGGTTR